MKIQLTGTISGTRNGKAWPPRGSIIELPDDEATGLLLGRMAKLPDEEQSADLKPNAETATRKPRKGLTTKDV